MYVYDIIRNANKAKEEKTEPKAKPRKRYNVDLHVNAP